MRCAAYEDQREADITRRALEFVASIWCGPPKDEPTPDNPVVEQTVRTAGGEFHIRKIEDFEFEKRTALLRQQAAILKEETKDIVEKMRTEARAARAARGDA